MDALALLIADHNRVRGGFSRFRQARKDKDRATMAAIAADIVEDLAVHTTIEEEIFYPWARPLSEEIGETIDEGLEEHHVMKVLVEELASLPKGDHEWTAKMTVLIENVEHHAGEEETTLFPSVRSKTSAAARKEIAEKLEARKRKLGAPVLADKIDLTTEELHLLATEQAIPGRTSMGHEQLAATVKPQ
jgi:hemerythrin superfamily protein